MGCSRDKKHFPKTMNALLNLGETATFELKQALLIYEARGGRAAGTTTAVTVHPVEGGVIRAGQAITYAAVESLASALGRNLAACYLPANVLSVSFGQVAWFCPAARRRLWFKVLADGHEKRLNGRFAQHPPLVFIASAHGLQAFAVVKNERPQAGTRLYRAPYWNLWESGKMCAGNCKLADLPTPASIPAYEDAFFNSAFTHTNLKQICKHPKGHAGLWTVLADGKKPDALLESQPRAPQPNRQRRADQRIMKHPLPASLVEDVIKISVAGCGGNGSQVLSGLPRLHTALRALGHHGLTVTAYDPDTITEANVGRQLFSPADIGQSKAHTLIHRLNCYYGLDWEAVQGCLRDDTNNVYRRTNFIIGCVDSIRSRQQLARCRADYWLDLGNTDKKGQVILGELREPPRLQKAKGPDGGVQEVTMRRHRLPHVLDIFPELKKNTAREDDAPSCSLAEALDRQDLFVNQTVATFALQLLWKFIREGGLDIHDYFINLERWRVSPLPIKT